ncbi:MAG: pentapeptide repeat-containing protein [Thermomicrobiales bacterium]|nr:pentapeptide repeat-containing protein [Thermomicrobiales bacterium]
MGFASSCRTEVDFVATLDAVGCAFSDSSGVWNCGSKDLSGANLKSCDLTNAGFSTANLSGASLVEAVLVNTFFRNATGASAVWADTTYPYNASSDDSGNPCCGYFLNGQAPADCPVE